jgi:hypothetical protein
MAQQQGNDHNIDVGLEHVSGELKLAENRRSESGCSSGAFSSTNST